MPTRRMVPALPTFTPFFIPLTFGSCISPDEYFQSFQAVWYYVAYTDDMAGPLQGRTLPSSSRTMLGTLLVASLASTSGSTSEGCTTQHALEPTVHPIPIPDYPGAVVEYID